MTLQNIDDLSQASSEELAEQYDQMRTARDEIIEGMSVLSDELADRLKLLKVSGSRFGKWDVTLSKPRISVSEISLSWARDHGAIDEKVSAEKIGTLHKKGIKIPGLKFGKPTVYIKDSEKPKVNYGEDYK